jgi:catechol 2,3-dioxygenase-like lactoylglutathione lyase family enzyme
MISPVTRLSHVAVRSPDVERLRSYYTEVVGLAPYDEVDGVVYLASGGYGPALELRPGQAPGLDHIGFEVSAAHENELLARLRDQNVTVSSSADSEPGLSRIHEVKDVEGNTLQLCLVDDGRPAAARATAGIGPNKIGHIAARTRSAAAVTDFYESALGFRWSDWMGDFFVFLRCNTDHHTVNFVNASRPGELHHFAFEVGDRVELLGACDTLASHGVRLIWGPGRHGVGHNMFIYHGDPDGNVVELFCDLDRIASEELGYFEPRPWHEDKPQSPKHWVPDPSSANQWGPGAPETFLA